MVTPTKKAAKPKTRDDDDEDDVEEIDEPEAMNDDDDDKAEPKPSDAEDVKAAAKMAKEAVDEDRKREVPLLETYKAASMQKQADWEKDAKEIFREEDLSKERRAKHIAAMDAMDVKSRAEQEELRKEANEKARKAEIERIKADAKTKREEADVLDTQAKELAKA